MLLLFRVQPSSNSNKNQPSQRLAACGRMTKKTEHCRPRRRAVAAESSSAAGRRPKIFREDALSNDVVKELFENDAIEELLSEDALSNDAIEELLSEDALSNDASEDVVNYILNIMFHFY